MRILQCIDSLAGGGAERQLSYACEGLVALGVEVEVAFRRDGENGARLRKSGAKLHELGWRQQMDPALAYPSVGWDLCRIIVERRIDVVHTWLRHMDMIGGLAARILRRPWIFSERSAREGGVQGWRESVRRSFAGVASAVVANSVTGAQAWKSALKRTPIYLVPNGMPLDEVAATRPASRASLGIPEAAPILLTVGRFEPEKNIALQAEVLSDLLRRHPTWYALCCGSGSLLPRFRSEMGPRCLTPGYRADIWALMKSANLFFSPSLFEGRPNTVLEAMACGCPLVLSEIPQHRELARDEARYFARESAAQAIAAIEATMTDRLATQARAERAARLVNDFSVAAMSRGYATMYLETLRRAGRSSPAQNGDHR
jgi:glycosyltransferase involved in cell wall biosynthesis